MQGSALQSGIRSDMAMNWFSTRGWVCGQSIMFSKFNFRIPLFVDYNILENGRACSAFNNDWRGD